MDIRKIKTRNILFSKNINNEWDLNIHVIQGNKYNYLIDTGLGSKHMEPIIEFLKQDKKEIVVVNTHSHWDHIWGHYLFSDSMIIAHNYCRDFIMNQWDDLIQKYGHNLEGETRKCLPNITFDKEIYFPDDNIRIFYTPGHTLDSISILDEIDHVLDVGDNIGDTVDEIVPSLDCDVDTYRNTLKKYQEYQVDTVLSGHNVVLGKDVFERILTLL